MSKRFIASDGPPGGCLIGYVTCSFAELVSLFGAPEESDGYKVSSEWGVCDKETGVEFRLYDYKETSLYDEGLPSVAQFRAQDSYEWHIGGSRSSMDYNAFAQFMSEQLGREVIVEEGG